MAVSREGELLNPFFSAPEGLIEFVCMAAIRASDQGAPTTGAKNKCRIFLKNCTSSRASRHRRTRGREPVFTDIGMQQRHRRKKILPTGGLFLRSAGARMNTRLSRRKFLDRGVLRASMIHALFMICFDGDIRARCKFLRRTLTK